MPPRRKNRILIIDDHPIFCLGMSELINKEDDLEVCGSVESMKMAGAAIDDLKPDLVVQSASRGEAIPEMVRVREAGVPVVVFAPKDFAGIFATMLDRPVCTILPWKTTISPQ